MKKLRQILLISLFALSFVSVGRVAAVSQCPTGYTGPDSNGTCTTATLYTCELGFNNEDETVYATINDIDLQVELEETQSGFTGTASTNGVTFTVSSPYEEETCEVVATTQATEVVEPAPSPAPAPVQPTVLADTNSGNNIVAVLVIASSAATIAYLLAAAAKRAKR